MYSHIQALAESNLIKYWVLRSDYVAHLSFNHVNSQQHEHTNFILKSE